MGEVHDLIRHLIVQLSLMKTEPHLPIWGSLYETIHAIQKVAKYSQQNVYLYNIENDAHVSYELRANRFVVKVGELNIRLHDYEFIDALIDGRFHPTHAYKNTPFPV